MKTRIRPAAVAGRFYPADAASLRQMIQSFLATAPRTGGDPKAIIAPHAGYVYSGPIAASAYASWAAARDTIRRVVLVGPAHFVPFRGLALPSSEAFETPLGEVPVDREALQRLLALPRVQLLDEAHTNEHSLEVQLPFLQTVLNRFSIVPVLAGQASDSEVCAVL
ncbi:MAG TPA: AmmeMemoRadiSam system protein B, partial [Verrucomicrobiota bacterium]|nr:AmmeMemoRadiSam system protein B [Verrucomicrobiota bacterium]